MMVLRGLLPCFFGCFVGLLLLTGLSGCGLSLPFSLPGSGPSLGQQVAEPPLIPAPPVVEELAKEADAEPAIPYTDVFGLPEDEQVRLKAVLTDVLKARVLPMPTSNVMFEPVRPITYGEFAQWYAAFDNHQKVQAGATDGEAVDESAAESAKAPATHHQPLPVQDSLLKETMVLHKGVELRPDSLITRQQWAALYLKLGRKTPPAKEENVAAMAPPGAAKSETFSQFKDFDAISAWARPAVGQAYKDQLLAEVFDLTPEQLAVDRGFQPQRKLTRAEALLFLHRLHQPLSH